MFLLLVLGYLGYQGDFLRCSLLAFSPTGAMSEGKISGSRVPRGTSLLILMLISRRIVGEAAAAEEPIEPKKKKNHRKDKRECL